MYEFLYKSLKEGRHKKTKYVYTTEDGGDFLNSKERVKNINEYKKRKKNRYRRRKIKRVVKPILCAFPVVSIIIINLCGNAIVSNYKYEINKLKKQLRKEEIVLDGLKMEQLENSSITNIEENAKEKLNMDYPNESQMRYIDLKD
ncbi:Cell division protein FtsL [Terrisporobacter mayombei]|uniref:Cell division protein FtsL n=1 Tax=Terrisporobacter mayombei TaxID=1541 RepID=A0ABY9Q2K7_9FIRM|nr:Cell division protein FtsL [Terrisporobacter mayombei]